MASRQTNWHTLVVRADPNFYDLSRNVIEYEFTSHASESELTHEAGLRVFRGDYQTRGPYRAVDSATDGIQWNSNDITWNGVYLSWDND